MYRLRIKRPIAADVMIRLNNYISASEKSEAEVKPFPVCIRLMTEGNCIQHF